MTDEQDKWDDQDAAVRLRQLVDAIQAEADAREEVRQLQSQLARSRAKHKNASRKLGELAFVERSRRNKKRG